MHDGHQSWQELLVGIQSVSRELRQRTHDSGEGKPADAERSQHGGVLGYASKFILIITCLLLGVCNRITYKAALTPMRNYLFFLAQLTNFGYLITYFTVLTIRYKSGIVTKAMLAIDKTPLILVGACEAIAQVLLMIGASNLPGVLLPIVSQSIMFWNFLFASIVLGARFSTWQILGALGVMSGVVFAGAPPQLLDILTGSSSTQIAVASQVDPFYVAVCVVCFAFPAMATIIKERLFKNAKDQLGVPLDIFVVNSFGSLFQTLFVVALLPFTSGALHGIAFSELPEYLGRGIQCLSGLQPSCGSDCLGAPLLPLIYVAFNLGFNVAMLTDLVVVLDCSKWCHSQIIGFMLPLPFPEPYIVGWNFYLGATLLCMGLGLYNFDKIRSSPNPPPLTAVQGDEAK
eukprot:gene24226-9825_t